jgi:cation diffusion facilitator CzcD-associated flavoprotein CzcO
VTSPAQSGKPASQRVAVVGSGVSGVLAASALLREGHEPVIFERRGAIGGLWHDVYGSVYLLSGHRDTTFRDFPMPENYPEFIGGAQFLDYIRAYARSEGVDQYMRFSTEVESAAPLGDGREGWLLRALDASGSLTEEAFDALVVATGRLSRPHLPTVPGTYSGTQFHTVDYRTPTQLDGRRILVVGSGNSACDLAVDAVNALKSRVLVSVRSPTWFAPPSYFARPRNDIFGRLGLLPDPLRNRLAEWMTRVSLGSPAQYGLPMPEKGSYRHARATASTLLPYWIQRGRVRVVGEIERLDGITVTFRDGTTEDVDTIVWATGYRPAVPFLAGALEGQDGSLPPRKAGGLIAAHVPNLYFCGFSSGSGGSPTLFALGAKTIARLITAQSALREPIADAFPGDPSRDVMILPPLKDAVRMFAAFDRRAERLIRSA